MIENKNKLPCQKNELHPVDKKTMVEGYVPQGTEAQVHSTY